MSKQPKLTNSFKTIAQLSSGTFDRNESYRQLQVMEGYENSVQDLMVDLRTLAGSVVRKIDEDSQPYWEVDLGGLELPLTNKAHSDLVKSSKTKIKFGHVGMYEEETDPVTGRSIAEVLTNAALQIVKSDEYKALVQGEKIRAFAGSGYPSHSVTGFSTSKLTNAILQILENEENFRPPVEGVEFTEPLFEARFDEETGNVYSKIVYDHIEDIGEILGIPLHSPFGFGVELRDNFYAAGKFVAGAFSLNKDCNNGQSSRHGIAGIVINHTSVQNMLTNKEGKGILDLMKRSFGYSMQPAEAAIIARLEAVANNPAEAFKKVQGFVDVDREDIFYDMLGRSILQYADFRRAMELDTIKAAATTSVEDVEKELSKLVEKGKMISQRDSATILNIMEEDDTIPEELRDTAYGLSAALTRYANNFHAENPSKYETLQEVGRSVMEVLPTINYDARRTSNNDRLY